MARPYQPDQDDLSSLEPRLTAAERDEVAQIGYFLEQWTSLRTRGIVSDVVFEQVVAEYRGKREAVELRGRYQAALFRAGNLIGIDPEHAARMGRAGPATHA